MQQKRKDNGYKSFVKVRLDHNTDGTIRPLMFRTDDGPAVKIDKVVDVRTAASTRGGGQGTRFTCRIGGKEIYLFLDGDYWFVENEQFNALNDAADVAEGKCTMRFQS